MGERMARLMTLMAETMTSDDPPEVGRQKIGAFALEVDTIPEEQFIDGFRYLDGEGWPAQYSCTAVDALSGEFVVWNGQPGVELSAAVASSCAVPGVFPPITINGRRYVDGGMRSGTNADLAKGHDRVFIITLMGGARAATPDPRFERMRERLDAEFAVLRDSGATIESIAPDDESSAVMGINLMDGSVSAAAAEAGMAQAKREGERLRALW